MGKIEAIIFDMDGTLYDLVDVVGMNYEMQLHFYSECSGKSLDSVIKEFEDNGIYPVVTSNAKSATEYFSQKGLDMDWWRRYRVLHFDETKIAKEKAVSSAIIERFHKNYVTVILTSNVYENVHKVLAWLGISECSFNLIICSDYNYPYEVFCKKAAFGYISEKLAIPFADMLSIGDRYYTDVEPLIQLGGRGIIVNRPIALEQVLDDLPCFDSAGMRNKEYHYFIR